MSISFSGLASGLDTSSWVTSLTALKQAKVTNLETKKLAIQTCQEALSNIRSYFSSFRSMLEKVTDTKFKVASLDIFSQNIATSANLNVLTATADANASEGTYEIKVDKLASHTNVVSGYKYTTTIIETTTATSASKLSDLGAKEGYIGVTVNGVEHGLKIEKSDTVDSFVDKLKGIGIDAYYNEETGVFSMNASASAINDIDDTGIVAALHLGGVNEGYVTNPTQPLEIVNTDTIYHVADRDTKLSDLGVSAGRLVIKANDTSYNVDIVGTDTIGGLIDALKTKNIDASIQDGVFSITNASITNDGATHLLEKFGMTNPPVAQRTQLSSALDYTETQTTITQATLGTRLSDVGTGQTIANNSKIVVKNSDNETKTITIGSESTIDNLLQGLRDAGMSAQMTNEGKVVLSGGTIEGGDINISSILGLQETPYSAMVTGNALSETVERVETAQLDTKLTDLGIGVGYLEVTDGANQKHYVKITESDTIESYMNRLSTWGIGTDFDESKGILTLTGGEFKTLTDGQVNSLISGGQISETNAKYKHGTNLINKLYGSDTISAMNTTVASASATSVALRHTVTTTQSATGSTALSQLGLNSGSSVVTFNVRGETRSLTVNSTMTIDGLVSALSNKGISASFDENTGRIAIENAKLTSSTTAGTLGGVLGLSETITGKYITSDKIYTVNTMNVSATGATMSTTLHEVADMNTTFGQLGINTRVAVVYNSAGVDISTISMTATQTIGQLFDQLASQGITGSISNGVVTLTSTTGKYMTGGLADAMGIGLNSTDYIASTSRISTASVTFTDTYQAGRNQTLAQIGALSSGNSTIVVKNSSNVEVGQVTVSSTTTVGSMLDQLSALDYYGNISEGVITFNSSNGYKAEGAVINYVKGKTLTYSDTRKVDDDVALSKFGVTNGEVRIHKDDGTYKTLTVSNSSTLGTFLNTLNTNGMNATVDNGTISVTGTGDTYLEAISGGTNIITQLKLGSVNKVNAQSHTNTHSDELGYNSTVVSTTDTTLEKLEKSGAGITFSGNNVSMVVTATSESGSTTRTLSFTKSSTVADVINALDEMGIKATLDSSGKFALSSDSLIDFNTSGTLSTFMMGSYTKNYGSSVNEVNGSTKLQDITNSSGVNLDITSGQMYVYQNGTRNLVTVSRYDSLDTLTSQLAQYGITMNVSSDGSIYFSGNGNSYLTTDGIASGQATNLLDKISVDQDWNTTSNSQSKALKFTTTSNQNIDGNTKLVEMKNTSGTSLGVTAGVFDVYNNGVKTTRTITSQTTVNDFLSMLASAGMTANITSDGSISVSAQNNSYAATSDASGASNVVQKLFNNNWGFVKTYTSDKIEEVKTSDVAISRDTKLADIKNASYQSGYITIVKDNVQTNISLTADETVGSLIDTLALYGFESTISVNGQLIVRNSGNSTLKDYSVPAQKSNALSILGIGDSNWIRTNTYNSDKLNVIKTNDVDVAATRDTLLSDLGVSTGEFLVYSNGVKYTALISSDETLGSLMDKLNSFGLTTSLVKNGNASTLRVVGAGDSSVAKSPSATNSSNIVETLFPQSGTSTLYNYRAELKTSEDVTTTVNATETTLVSYFDKGANKSEGIVSVTIDDLTSQIQVTADETMGSLLDKFRSVGLEASLSNGKILIQSGFKDFTINTDTTTSHLLTNLNMVYDRDLGGYAASTVACESTTTTIEDRTASVANYADYSTKMSMINISTGTLSLYRNGQRATIQVNSDETFAQLRSRVADEFSDIDLVFENGYLKFKASSEDVIVDVGATTDSSNFASICGLISNKTNAVTSSRELYRVNGDSKLTTAGLFKFGDVTQGTFTVGDEVIEIGENTTLNDVISRINSSEKSNATAYWDSVDGKFIIKSRITGSSLINIEAGTSNFTDAMGYTTTERNGGTIVSKVNKDAQEIGDNSRFSINGTYFTSTSNTVKSDVSRIQGVTINLKDVTQGETVRLTIEKDKETVANTMSDIVDSYNELITNVNEEIAKTGNLADQTGLKMLKNQIRSLMTSSIAGTAVFKNLASIGISVDAATAGNISTASLDTLKFDKDKFISAFNSDLSSMKALLIGTDSTSGIFTSVESILEGALDGGSGYFASATNSYNKKIRDYDNKIDKANKAVETYRARLEAKFASMDLLIANMQNQYSSFLGI